MEIVGISFQKNGRIEYYDTNHLQLKKNITVLVESDYGLRFGKVETELHPVDETKLKRPLKKIVRIASRKDFEKHRTNLKLEEQALKKCRELVKQLHLEMNVLDALYTFEHDQLIFHFFSENRVDFRELARELASIYRVRIELRQIGVRDKAKEVGGVGGCGQQLCCSRFLKDFDSVSISMAKNQNLALSPNKINGVCGRLLCCLKYENDTYKQERKKLPSIGTMMELTEGLGKVISVDILKQTYKVEIPKVGVIEFHV